MENQEKRTTLYCESCGAGLEVDPTQETVTCPYCDTSFAVSLLLGESEQVRIHKITSNAIKDIELGRQEIEKIKLQHNIEREKEIKEEEAVSKFKKSRFGKVLIGFSIFSFLMCVGAFNNDSVFAGLIGVLMTALFVISYLMGSKVVKEPKKGLRVLLAIVAFVLIIPFFRVLNSTETKAETIIWEDIELGRILVAPESDIGEIISNNGEHLSLYIYDTTKDAYKSYVNKCISQGYTVDSEKMETSYTAYSKEGYELWLWYYESSEEMHINLTAPIEVYEFQWPDCDVAKVVPVPNSKIGNISWENSEGFYITVANTSISEFKSYITTCSDSGFNIDYQKGDDYYWANDKYGNHISLNYIRNNMMTIKVTSIEGFKYDEKESDNNQDDDQSGFANLPNTSKLTFILNGTDKGEYGKTIVFNKGTDGEIIRCAYYVPEGTYIVTNLGKYANQVNVYSTEIIVTDEGWEEPKTGEAKRLDPGSSGVITVSSGEYVYVTASSNFKFELQ